MTDWLTYGPLALSMLSNLFAGGAWVYGWQSRKHSAHADDLKAIDLRIKTLEMELSIQRERLQHIPNKEQIHDLSIALGDMKGEHKALYATVKAMGDQISTIGATLIRIDDHLREHAA